MTNGLLDANSNWNTGCGITDTIERRFEESGASEPSYSSWRIWAIPQEDKQCRSLRELVFTAKLKEWLTSLLSSPPSPPRSSRLRGAPLHSAGNEEETFLCRSDQRLRAHFWSCRAEAHLRAVLNAPQTRGSCPIHSTNQTCAAQSGKAGHVGLIYHHPVTTLHYLMFTDDKITHNGKVVAT